MNHGMSGTVRYVLCIKASVYFLTSGRVPKGPCRSRGVGCEALSQVRPSRIPKKILANIFVLVFRESKKVYRPVVLGTKQASRTDKQNDGRLKSLVSLDA